jgi:outer membrane lipoprotein SlyB
MHNQYNQFNHQLNHQYRHAEQQAYEIYHHHHIRPFQSARARARDDGFKTGHNIGLIAGVALGVFGGAPIAVAYGAMLAGGVIGGVIGHNSVKD